MARFTQIDTSNETQMARMHTTHAKRTADTREVAAVDTTGRRIGSMLRLDFYRLFHTPLLYVMCAVSAIIPAMVLTMVSANEAADAQSFTNAWQVVEMIQGGSAGMDLMSLALLCNINMVYIFAAILVSIFVSHDYSSGFVKSIFTVHAKKGDYVISKSVVGVFSGTLMLTSYFGGAMLAGAIAQKSFELGAASVLSVAACLLGKVGLMGLFVPLYLIVAVFFRQRFWLTLMGCFAVGILFYPVAMISAPLNATILNLAMCLAGGALFGLAFQMVSRFILTHRDLA